MLNKKYRLTKRGSFNYVYRKGKAVRGRSISLIYTYGRELPKVGFSVSNKIGHAVVRNKLKRRMRAVIGGLISKIRPCQAVFTVKAGSGEMDFYQIEKEMRSLLVKSELIKTPNGKEKDQKTDN